MIIPTGAGALTPQRRSRQGSAQGGISHACNENGFSRRSLAGALANAAPATAKDYKIGYSVFWGTNPFLVTMVNGAKKAVDEWKAKGVNIDLLVTNGGDDDKAKQVSDLEDLSAQKIDGVLIFPGDSVMVAEPIKTIFNAQNIPVVITDIGIRSGKYISLIITDNSRAVNRPETIWRRCSRRAARSLRSTTRRRTTMARHGARASRPGRPELGLEVLTEQPVARLTFDDSRKAMEDLLVSEPDVKGAFAFNQLVLQGAYQALEQAGKAGEVKLVGFDLDPCPTRWSRTARSTHSLSRTLSRWATRA